MKMKAGWCDLCENEEPGRGKRVAIRVALIREGEVIENCDLCPECAADALETLFPAAAKKFNDLLKEERKQKEMGRASAQDAYEDRDR